MNTARVTLGDAAFTVSYEVSGQHLMATMTDPEEWPEIELRQLATAGGEDVSGLLEFEPVYERALEQVTQYERENREEAMADSAYDLWKDEQLETWL